MGTISKLPVAKMFPEENQGIIISLPIIFMGNHNPMIMKQKTRITRRTVFCRKISSKK